MTETIYQAIAAESYLHWGRKGCPVNQELFFLIKPQLDPPRKSVHVRYLPVPGTKLSNWQLFDSEQWHLIRSPQQFRELLQSVRERLGVV
jgi:hypothetical protein